MQNGKKARVIAMYLPQYHPIPENDIWWGKGFTEWINVAKAKPLFKGHEQPKIPADLGFYDLRIPEVREEQAVLAKKAGIEGFCYWHYWFGNGKQLLERPFNEVLKSGKPDFPFCLGWANHSWSNKSWEAGTRKIKESILMEQTYPGVAEHTQHFYYVLEAFKDHRYITVDGKPVFVVFDPLAIPDVNNFILLWQKLAKENGLQGIHFIGILQSMLPNDKTVSNLIRKKENFSCGTRYQQLLDMGFDAINSRGYVRAEFMVRNYKDFILRFINQKLFRRWVVSKCDFSEINKYLFCEEDKWENVYPTLLPNWDRTPRSGKSARVYYGSTPKKFKEQVKNALSYIKDKDEQHKILFLQSWNEWGEGNYIEPDLKYGHGYINALYEALTDSHL